MFHHEFKSEKLKKCGNVTVAGTWVQCCKPACKKWRYLPDVHDPVQVHDLWVCSMHPGQCMHVWRGNVVHL